MSHSAQDGFAAYCRSYDANQRKIMERAMNRREIDQEVVEAQTLTCLTCSTIVEVPGYCSSCKDYWDDVRNGMFEQEWDPKE